MYEELQVRRKMTQLLPSENERTIVLLTGARQTGKTTLVKDKYSGLKYFNLDAVEFRQQLSEISTFSWHKNVGNAILDEIQKEPGLFEKIKFSFDEGQLTFTVLTGSSQVLLLKKVRETMAGRIKLFELFPLMLSELVDPYGEKKSSVCLEQLTESKSLDTLFKDYPSVLLGNDWEALKTAEDLLIKWGGMPSLLHIKNDNDRINWLHDYAVTYLERDLADLARLSHLMPFRKFQAVAALRAANVLQYSELARDAGISVETSRRYMEYLSVSYQNFLLQPYYKNLTSSLVKAPKLFWTDNGLLRQSSGIGFNITTGQLYENYVVSETVKYMKTIRNNAGLYYYRTRSGMEIDLIIETQYGLIAIEIKNRDTVVQSDFSSIKKLAAVAGKQWVGGIVAYRGNKIEKFGNNLWAVPSSRLLS